MLICWDMDETLGWFRPVADVLVDEATRWPVLGRFFGPAIPPVEVREGIAATLAHLRSAGFTQVVTTGGFREYAARALGDAGLAPLLDGVFARDVVWDGWGKRYGSVLERFGASPDETIIVGDDWKKDRASDHSIVLIHQPEGWKKPAALVGKVIEGLAESGSFAKGFEALLASAKEDVYGRLARVREVPVRVGHWGNLAKGDVTPVVSELGV